MTRTTCRSLNEMTRSTSFLYNVRRIYDVKSFRDEHYPTFLRPWAWEGLVSSRSIALDFFYFASLHTRYACNPRPAHLATDAQHCRAELDQRASLLAQLSAQRRDVAPLPVTGNR